MHFETVESSVFISDIMLRFDRWKPSSRHAKWMPNEAHIRNRVEPYPGGHLLLSRTFNIAHSKLDCTVAILTCSLVIGECQWALGSLHKELQHALCSVHMSKLAAVGMVAYVSLSVRTSHHLWDGDRRYEYVSKNVTTGCGKMSREIKNQKIFQK